MDVRTTWFKCAATQGRTSKPDSPSAPPSCATTATITGRVFCQYIIPKLFIREKPYNNFNAVASYKVKTWQLILYKNKVILT